MDPMIGQSLEETLGSSYSLQMSGNPNSMMAADIAATVNTALPAPDNSLHCSFNSACAAYTAPQQAPAEPAMTPDYQPAAPGNSM